MARGEVSIDFDFNLGGTEERPVVILNCKATFMFGELRSVVAYFEGKFFDPDGILIDWDCEFMPMSEKLRYLAKQFYHKERGIHDESTTIN